MKYLKVGLLLQIPQKKTPKNSHCSQKLKYHSVHNGRIDSVGLQVCFGGTLDHTTLFLGLSLDYIGNLVS